MSLQQIGAWAGAVVSVMTLIGLIVTAGMRIGSLQRTIETNTGEIQQLRTDVRALNNYIRGSLPGPTAPGDP